MVYRFFSSLRTSVYILAAMCLVFLTGTIFPQGEDIEDYIEAGGKYVAVVRALDFLDIFMSPLFLTLTLILVVNLSVCLYDRFRIFIKMKRKPMDADRLLIHPKVLTFEQDGFESRLEKAGFRFRTETYGAVYHKVKIYEKGLPYWWLSWLYHAGIILAISGFFVTALFAFENYVLLYPDKPETISLYSKNTRWNTFMTALGMETGTAYQESDYILTLDEFRTEYYQTLKLDYPEDRTERFMLGIGIKNIEPSKEGFSYMSKMWQSRLDVKKPDGSEVDGTLWVNSPFRTGGLTLYQMGYEQKADLSVNGESMDVEARTPFSVNNTEGKFMLGTIRTGELYKRDGSTEAIRPFTTVYHVLGDNPAGKEELGELELGGSLDAKGITFVFKDFKEGSWLSYRKDPGVSLVSLACWFVFTGLFVRALGAWYRIQYTVENGLVYALISTRGILADRDRIIKKLG